MGSPGDVLGAAGSALGSFGGSDPSGGGGSSSSSSVSGYYALPPQAQSAYNNYFNLVNNIGSQSPLSVPNGGFSNYTPTNDIFNSAGLTALQGANPNTPMNPSGIIEPLNQTQKSALSIYADPALSEQFINLAQNPYNSMVLNPTIAQMQRQYAINQGNITDAMNATDPWVLGNSALGTEYAQNNKNFNQDLASTVGNLLYGGYNSATSLASSLLSNMYNAGSAIQSQNQSALSTATPTNYATYNYQTQPQYLQANALAPLFGAFPQSSQSSSQSSYQGATPILSQGQFTSPTTAQRIGGLFMQAAPSNFSLSNALQGLI